MTENSSGSSTVYVEDPPRRMLGNVLIDGADGQCIYVYAGIEERCQNDAVAHTFLEHGGESKRVEMCAEHAREDVPEPPRLEQQELTTDGGELKYLSNGELREEIAYTVGGDPSRYGVDSDRGLLKADVLRVAERLQPEDSPLDLESMRLRDLYPPVCRWAGGEYEPNAGQAWGIGRWNLKQIHRALDAEPPREVVSP